MKYLLILSIGLMACTSSEKQAESQSKEDEKVPSFAGKWIEGDWMIQTGDTVSSEKWVSGENGELLGFAFTRVDDDTLFTENVRIHLENGDWYYTPKFIDAEGEAPEVNFKGIQVNDEHLVFSLPEHDFPNEIHYLNKGANQLDAYVNGKNGDTIKFSYTRVK